MEAVIKAMREAAGDRCDILIGTHGQLTTHAAIRLAKRLEPYEPLWFEEPVAPGNVDEMARVAHATSIPVATGERLMTRYEFLPLLQKQAASIVQMDLSITGGISETRKIATMAETHYAHIAPARVGRPVRGGGGDPRRRVLAQLPDPGGHRDLLRVPPRDPARSRSSGRTAASSRPPHRALATSSTQNESPPTSWRGHRVRQPVASLGRRGDANPPGVQTRRAVEPAAAGRRCYLGCGTMRM